MVNFRLTTELLYRAASDTVDSDTNFNIGLGFPFRYRFNKKVALYALERLLSRGWPANRSRRPSTEREKAAEVEVARRRFIGRTRLRGDTRRGGPHRHGRRRIGERAPRR